jgi:hypothetical protein
LPDKVTEKLRRQALHWLRAELAVKARLARSREPSARLELRKAMQGWLRDPGLASVRNSEALQKLPIDERETWRQFWQEVDRLLRTAQSGK